MKGTVKETRVRIEHFSLPILLLILLILPFWSKQEFAFAEQEPTQTVGSGPGEPAPHNTDGKYHTPLAGEPFHLEFMGRSIVIPARDRGNLASLQLGGTFYFSELTDTTVEPLFALYMRRTWEQSRVRIVASGLVNEADGAKSFGHPEFLARFENYTIPFSEKGFRRNEGVDESSLKWGTLSAFLGAGLRYPVAPYQVDNDLRLQVLGRVGYLYSKETSETGPDVKLPPDTMLYGVKLRGRYDGIRRNLMELPHTGMAAGFDLDFVYRENWADYGNRSITFKKRIPRTTSYYQDTLWAPLGFPACRRKIALSPVFTEASWTRRAPTATTSSALMAALSPKKRMTSIAQIIQGLWTRSLLFPNISSSIWNTGASSFLFYISNCVVPLSGETGQPLSRRTR